MAKKPLPCPTVLRQLLRYEPETGMLFWKPRARIWFNAEFVPTDRAVKAWNNRYAGTEAFTANSYGYNRGAIFGEAIAAHRVIYAIMSGAWPSDEIDHINGVRSDNRWKNLRLVDRSTNNRNTKMPNTNTSGHVGVGRYKRSATSWIAQIHIGKKHIHLGVFDNFDDAVSARKEAERVHGFHSNHGRAG